MVCYCCGKPIKGKRFAMVTLKESADRGFFLLIEHATRVTDGVIRIVEVQ